MTKAKNNEVVEILKEIVNTERKRIDVSKVKFAHHEASRVEPMMSDEDFNALLEDVKLVGLIHTPVILYNNKIVDGRHRQKIAIKLNLSLPVIELKGDYSLAGLEEFVRSKHMGRDKTRVQKEIQAFKYKRTVAGVTYSSAAARYGVKERSIRSITMLYNLLHDNGYGSDFDNVITTLEYGLSLNPKNFEWLSRTTSSFNSAIKQFKDFLSKQKDKSDIEFDPTEYEKIIDSETGEVVTKEIEKKKNVFQIDALDIEKLLTRIDELENEIKQLREENRQLKEELNRVNNSNTAPTGSN